MSKHKHNWVWFGNAGHFICGHMCRFHLTTKVGKYLVSTVGQLWLGRGSQEIHASIYDPKWHAENNHLKGDYYDSAYMKRFGFEDIGADRKFETMVFKLSGEVCEAKDCDCGMPSIVPSELDFAMANTAREAHKHHMRLCNKWDKK